MLILAGISIAMLTGDNGLLTKADKATEEHSHASVREGIILAYNEYQTELQTLAEETQIKGDVKLASTEVTKVAELNITKDTSFIEFLQGKGYTDANGIVNTQELLGSKTKLGNGDGAEYKDVYIVSSDEENNRYVLTYHYTRDEKKELWDVAANEDNSIRNKKQLIIRDWNIGCGDMTITYIEGMTWRDWINSSYNDPESDFYIGEDCYDSMYVMKAHVPNEHESWGAPGFIYEDDINDFEIKMDDEIDSSRSYSIGYAE